VTAPPRSPARPEALVIGLGNRYRRDDAAGLAVAARVRAAGLPGVKVTELEGEPLSLLDACEGAGQVYVADAVSSGGEPGTVYRFDAITGLPPPAMRHRGTHTFSLADVIELGRALGVLPRRLVAYGIEGAGFGAGTGLSAAVEDAVSKAAADLTGELTAAWDRR
jgi:hydrogenase maturation protease